MKNNTMIPGYKTYDYLLVLNPHEELRHKIIQVKEQFAKDYKSNFAVHSKPHIALATFTQYGMIEERIINRLHTIAMGFPPIKIELKDYGSFPTHTIFINVASKLTVTNLVKKIRTDAQRLLKLDGDNKPHFLLDPFIPIGRKLMPWQYEKGWLEYSHKHFTGRFIADGMLLLKRPSGELNYQAVQRFEFQNLPVNTVQASLFSPPMSPQGGI